MMSNSNDNLIKLDDSMFDILDELLEEDKNFNS